MAENVNAENEQNVEKESIQADNLQEPEKPPVDDQTKVSGGEEEVPQEDQLEKIKETTEKLWGSTVNDFTTATFRANQYKKLVQKKIDLSALHKKISATHADLGKLIDDLREAGKKSIMSTAAVKETLEKLDALKAEAAALEQEVEQLRSEEPPAENTEE